jgi:hypothetical protein
MSMPPGMCALTTIKLCVQTVLCLRANVCKHCSLSEMLKDYASTHVCTHYNSSYMIQAYHACVQMCALTTIQVMY